MIYNTTTNKFQGYGIATTNGYLNNSAGNANGLTVGANSGIGQTFKSTGNWVLILALVLL
jgi:hypothetical protein